MPTQIRRFRQDLCLNTAAAKRYHFVRIGNRHVAHNTRVSGYVPEQARMKSFTHINVGLSESGLLYINSTFPQLHACKAITLSESRVLRCNCLSYSGSDE